MECYNSTSRMAQRNYGSKPNTKKTANIFGKPPIPMRMMTKNMIVANRHRKVQVVFLKVVGRICLHHHHLAPPKVNNRDPHTHGHLSYFLVAPLGLIDFFFITKYNKRQKKYSNNNKSTKGRQALQIEYIKRGTDHWQCSI